MYQKKIRNLKPIDWGIEEIFDKNEFQKMKCITYVSSPTFFSKIIEGFEEVELIVGIEDNKLINSFNGKLEKILNQDKVAEFINDLSKENKNKINENKLSIRYAAKGSPIHSKIYILESSDGLRKRVIVGSVNLTEKAFTGKQYEEIIIFDNVENEDYIEVMNEYRNRYEEIKEDTLDYIPERVRDEIKKGNYEINIIDNPDIITEQLLEIAEMEKGTVFVTTEVFDILDERKKYSEEERRSADIATQLIEVMTKKKGDTELKIKTAKELEKIKPKIRNIFSKKHNKNSMDNDIRINMQYEKNINSIFIKGQEEVETDKMKRYNEREDLEKIRKNIENIHKFIEAYTLFTENGDVEKQKRIYEIILYTMTSPFIWKIREDYVSKIGREAVRSDFEPFLFIGGRAYSGKSTALEFANKLISPHANTIQSYAQQENYLLDFFESNNVFPILSEEVPIGFFNSKAKAKGENLIKEISNNRKKEHPVLIAVTNSTDFVVNQQMARRIYYLQIENSFKTDAKTKEQASKYLEEIFENTDEALFKDFCERMCEKINEEQEFYKTGDVLNGAREIFKDYYKELGMKEPKFFPNEKFDDSKNRGVITWNKLYKQYGNKFKEKRFENTIFVERELFKNEKEQKALTFLLPSYVIKEDSSGILILNRNEFLKYINVKNFFKF